MFYDKQKKQKIISFSIKRTPRTIQLFGVELNSKLSNAKFIIIYILTLLFKLNICYSIFISQLNAEMLFFQLVIDIFQTLRVCL